MDVNNKVLMVLRDKDVFQNPADDSNIDWKVRSTVKVVLFNEHNQIALMGNKVNDFFLLPGGGVEGSESILDCVKRECQEETGCKIKIKDMLGVTEDFRVRDSKHAITYGYSAKVISHGIPTLTEKEIDIGAYVRWISLPDAIEIFKHQELAVKEGRVKFYNTCFNILRDSLFIRCAGSAV